MLVVTVEPFNKGPSEKGTTSLQRTLPISPKVYMQYILNLTASPTRDKMAGPKVSLSQGFHCTSSSLFVCLFIAQETDSLNLNQLNDCCIMSLGCILLLILKQHIIYSYNLSDKLVTMIILCITNIV